MKQIKVYVQTPSGKFTDIIEISEDTPPDEIELIVEEWAMEQIDYGWKE